MKTKSSQILWAMTSTISRRSWALTKKRRKRETREKRLSMGQKRKKSKTILARLNISQKYIFVLRGSIFTICNLTFVCCNPLAMILPHYHNNARISQHCSALCERFDLLDGASQTVDWDEHGCKCFACSASGAGCVEKSHLLQYIDGV